MIGKPAVYRGRTEPLTDDQLLFVARRGGGPALTFDERVRLQKLRKKRKAKR